MSQSLLALVGPRLTQHALDVAVPKHDVGLLGLLAALCTWRRCVLDFVVEYGGTLLTTYIGQRVMYDLRMQIFEHLQRLSISYFDRNPVGRLMTRVTSDVETLNELFSSGVVTDLRRRVHAGRHHGDDAGDRLAAGAGHLRGDPAGLAHRPDLPPPGAPGVRRHPGAAGPAQRLPAGAAERDAGRAAVRPGGGRGAPVRGAQPGAPRGAPPLDHDLRGVLPGRSRC